MLNETRITDRLHNVLMRGKGLRPILRYAAHHPVDAIRVDYSVNEPSQYAVTFYFADGAQGLTRWGDWRVLVDWLLARRSWSFHRLRFAPPDLKAEAFDHLGVHALRKRGVEIAGPPS